MERWNLEMKHEWNETIFAVPSLPLAPRQPPLTSESHPTHPLNSAYNLEFLISYNSLLNFSKIRLRSDYPNLLRLFSVQRCNASRMQANAWKNC